MPNGILVIDKPADWTSMDVCAKVRGLLGEKRVGHGGTLDPMATGVLPVFVGRATRAVPFVMDSKKEYIAGLKLGVVTDTQDITGTILEQRAVKDMHQEVLRVLAALQTGGLCAAGWQAGEENLHPDAPEQQPTYQAVQGASVQIYTMPTCSYCRSVKEFLQGAGIAYQEFNLEHNKAGQDFMRQRRYTGLPVTVINGEEIVGYNMPKIKAALGMN